MGTNEGTRSGSAIKWGSGPDDELILIFDNDTTYTHPAIIATINAAAAKWADVRSPRTGKEEFSCEWVWTVLYSTYVAGAAHGIHEIAAALAAIDSGEKRGKQ